MDSHELRNAFGHNCQFTKHGESNMIGGELKTTGATNSFERVKEFHEKFNAPVADALTVPDDERLTLRMALILEEALELADALGFATDDIKDSAAYMLNRIGPRVYEDEIDLVAVADALGDLEYVTNGTAIEMGINLPEVVKEIHRSNMTKLGRDSKPIYREDGKVLKGEDYESPDIAGVLFDD